MNSARMIGVLAAIVALALPAAAIAQSTLPLRPEVEPNNSIASPDPAPIASDTAIEGALSPAGDRDFFRVEVAHPGLVDVRHEVSAPVPGQCAPGDSVLRLYDAEGTLLAEDDDSGFGRCSQITRALATGSYLIEVLEFCDFSTCDAREIPAYTLEVQFSPREDSDGDGVRDLTDNCPLAANPDQADDDGDGRGDLCDGDDDNDGVADATDNCPSIANPAQADLDADGQGDVCDADDDGDGVADTTDNCVQDANPGQANLDGDARGDVCDTDDDGDAVSDGADNCPQAANPDQTDLDGDDLGNECDPDADGDGVENAADNCDRVANPDQADRDADGIGDACDPTDDSGPTSTPGCTLGAGDLATDTKGVFAFKVSYRDGAQAPAGGFVFADRRGRGLRSTSITRLVVTGATASFSGTGRTNRGDTVEFEAEVSDLGHGRADTLTVRWEGYETTGTVKHGDIEVGCEAAPQSLARVAARILRRHADHATLRDLQGL